MTTAQHKSLAQPHLKANVWKLTKGTPHNHKLKTKTRWKLMLAGALAVAAAVAGAVEWSVGGPGVGIVR